MATKHVTTDIAVESRAFDAAAQRWWRIRESGGTVFWEISADGITFVQLAKATDVTGLDRVAVRIQLDGNGLVEGPVEAHVDNVNHLP